MGITINNVVIAKEQIIKKKIYYFFLIFNKYLKSSLFCGIAPSSILFLLFVVVIRTSCSFSGMYNVIIHKDELMFLIKITFIHRLQIQPKEITE